MLVALLSLVAVQAPAHVAPRSRERQVQVAPALKTCPVEGVIPRELDGWRIAAPVVADRMPVPIAVGQGVRATLLPTSEVSFPVAPSRPAAAGTSGGAFAFEVARTGRYRVALGSGAWIEVVRAGRALPSVSHAHGPECSPVRKMVDFDLKAGRYLLEVAGNPTTALGLMIARL